MKSFLAYLSTPTSKAGITAVLSAVVSGIAGVTSWLHVVPLVAFGIAMIAMPDNTVAQKDIEQLVSDAVDTAIAVKAAPVAPVTPASSIKPVV